jgi:hypothetical protein
MSPVVSGIVFPVEKPSRLWRMAYPPRITMGAVIVVFHVVAAASW